MKVVINDCFGGFDLSKEALKLYNKKSRKKCKYVWDIPRNDPHLIEVVEELGENANGTFSDLRIIEIPDDVEWHIREYDGREHVAENHRTWE